MKTNALLILASLVTCTTIASASQFPTNDELVVLPAYTVAAPRFTSVEKQINSSLAEMRQMAKAPAFVPAELPSLKALTSESAAFTLKARSEKSVRIAKL